MQKQKEADTTKPMKSLKFLIITVLILSFQFCTQKGKEETRVRFMTIGTGGLTGVYYPTGASMCSMIDKNALGSKNIQCNVQSTAGSVYNLNAIHSKEIEFGIVQSDMVFRAWEGLEPFPEKYSELRSVFSIYSEPMNLVARKDAKISSLQDIKGKKVNIGNPGSGQKRTSTELLTACGMTESDLALAGSLKPAEMPDGLRDQKLDAYFYTVAHPTANIKDIAHSVPITLVPLEGDCIDQFVESHPFYVKTKVPGGLYDGVEQEVPTFAVKATVMTHKDTPDALVRALLDSIVTNMDEFKQLHPAYRDMTLASIQEGLVPPFHPAAKRYFEQGK
ncbi:MAG: TAXI family TRAP transporter solute-binding subunit [Bdellovibrionales bacterium]|nr:TAXI family TRAP transporter solute-binding subunit [Bdellovibrionales bacterium]